MTDNEPLTPEQAAVFCAVHGFQLWEDTKDYALPWAVERDNWRTWYWTEQLTMAGLRTAMAYAYGDPQVELDLGYRRLLGKTIIRVYIPNNPSARIVGVNGRASQSGDDEDPT